MRADLEWDQSPGDVAARLRDLESRMQDELDQAGDEIGQLIGDDAGQRAPSSSGQLSESLRHVVDEVGTTILQIYVGSNVDYARAQEYGTDPFFPPPSALREWASRTLGDADLAYPVAQSISETGIEEKRFLRDAFEENLTQIVETIRRAVKRALP